MEAHGLADWRFQFDRAKRRFGCCWSSRKMITLSRPLTFLNEVDEVRDTILHEIAHALVPGGHTRAWRRKCIEIGAVPRRCFSGTAVKMPQIRRRHQYVARCQCAEGHTRKRRPSVAYICRRCGQRLKWVKQILVTPAA